MKCYNRHENEMMLLAATWMDAEMITLTNQRKTNTITSLICGIYFLK